MAIIRADRVVAPAMSDDSPSEADLAPEEKQPYAAREDSPLSAAAAESVPVLW